MLVLLHHLGAEDVGRHQVRRELDAAGIEAEHDAQRLDELGLGEAGDADQQRMAAGKQRHQRPLDDAFLAEDDAADAVAHAGNVGERPFGLGDHVLARCAGWSLIDDAHAASIPCHRPGRRRRLATASVQARRLNLNHSSRLTSGNNSDYFVTMTEAAETAAADSLDRRRRYCRACRADRARRPAPARDCRPSSAGIPDFCGDLDMEIRPDGTLVLSRHADRPHAAGAALFHGAAEGRGRQDLSGHAGREGGHQGGRRAVRRRRDERVKARARTRS